MSTKVSFQKPNRTNQTGCNHIGDFCVQKRFNKCDQCDIKNVWHTHRPLNEIILKLKYLILGERESINGIYI